MPTTHTTDAVRYVAEATPFGSLLAAAKHDGICEVRFGEDTLTLISRITAEYPEAVPAAPDDVLHTWFAQIDCALRGDGAIPSIPLAVRGTAFQREVWNALRQIPAGKTRSYGEVAASIGAPKSARAVAQACAANPVALVVPCHRVIRGDGHFGGYRWGEQRKAALLEMERHRLQEEEAAIIRRHVIETHKHPRPVPPSDVPAVGSTLAGRFELVRFVGAGGAGAVFEAHDHLLDEVVAVKVMLGAMKAETGFRAAVAELRLARGITHANVVRTFDLGRCGDVPYYVMEFVHGASLADVLESGGPLPVDATVAIGGQLLRALGAVHARGIVHRDIKPQNVLLSADGQVKLTDFGVASLYDALETASYGDATPGTLSYLAPEVLLGEGWSRLADLYAVAVVLHEALLGTVPFRGRTERAVVGAMMTTTPLPVEQADNIPPRLRALLLSALSLDPSNRPASAALFHDALAATVA